MYIEDNYGRIITDTAVPVLCLYFRQRFVTLSGKQRQCWSEVPRAVDEVTYGRVGYRRRLLRSGTSNSHCSRNES
jgi:hypothetical protein